MAFAGALCPRSGSEPTLISPRPGLPREKVLAAVVRLLETTLIRVGNEEYARSNRVVRPDHDARSPRQGWQEGRPVRVPGQERGQARDRPRRPQVSPGSWANAATCPARSYFSTSTRKANPPIRSTRPRSTRLSQQAAGLRVHCQGLPDLGRDRPGVARPSRVRGVRLANSGQEERRPAPSNDVAERLGNTPSVCRKCYVHPEVIEAYLDGSMLQDARSNGRRTEIKEQPRSDLRPEEGRRGRACSSSGSRGDLSVKQRVIPAKSDGVNRLEFAWSGMTSSEDQPRRLRIGPEFDRGHDREPQSSRRLLFGLLLICVDQPAVSGRSAHRVRRSLTSAQVRADFSKLLDRPKVPLDPITSRRKVAGQGA